VTLVLAQRHRVRVPSLFVRMRLFPKRHFARTVHFPAVSSTMGQFNEANGLDSHLFDVVVVVVVVGRGPVGLYATCERRLRGLSVLIVERRTRKALSEIAETRACVVHGRTLEVLENRGFLKEFKKAGTQIPWWHYGVLDTRLDSRRLPTKRSKIARSSRRNTRLRRF